MKCFGLVSPFSDLDDASVVLRPIEAVDGPDGRLLLLVGDERVPPLPRVVQVADGAQGGEVRAQLSGVAVWGKVLDQEATANVLVVAGGGHGEWGSLSQRP